MQADLVPAFDVGWYYYFVHHTWTLRECAEVLRAMHGRFTVDEWVASLESSTKVHRGELGRAGGLIFVYADLRYGKRR